QEQSCLATNWTRTDDENSTPEDRLGFSVLPSVLVLQLHRSPKIFGEHDQHSEHPLGDWALTHSPRVGDHDVAMDDLFSEQNIDTNAG
ncbi:hypothetical protein, partial [Paraburkholderia sp. SIMBA_053]|uniref:hypothetical protein n=1 Tax=Paraburkholderia sp. SIMBA_053 TaxID=3085794 RepID=UPI00397CF125